MNEEHSVINFFAQEENLPLALIAAEHLDDIRRQHNNRFWKALREPLDVLLATKWSAVAQRIHRRSQQ